MQSASLGQQVSQQINQSPRARSMSPSSLRRASSKQWLYSIHARSFPRAPHITMPTPRPTSLRTTTEPARQSKRLLPPRPISQNEICQIKYQIHSPNRVSKPGHPSRIAMPTPDCGGHPDPCYTGKTSKNQGNLRAKLPYRENFLRQKPSRKRQPRKTSSKNFEK